MDRKADDLAWSRRRSQFSNPLARGPPGRTLSIEWKTSELRHVAMADPRVPRVRP